MYVGWCRFNFCKILCVTSTKMSTNDICKKFLNTLALHSKLIRKGQKKTQINFSSQNFCVERYFNNLGKTFFSKVDYRSFTNKKPAKLVVSSKNVEKNMYFNPLKINFILYEKNSRGKKSSHFSEHIFQ